MGFDTSTDPQTGDYRIVKWMDAHHTRLLRDYHQLRKNVFVDGLTWTLPNHGGYEWDQYDGPRSLMLLREEGGTCTGGCRLIRCDGAHRFGEVEFSYTIRDAHRGILPGIPRELAEHAPTDKGAWELSRAISGGDAVHFKALLARAARFVQHQGGDRILLISRPASLILVPKWGYRATALGPRTRIGTADWLALMIEIPD
ncbi:acyl-homoserine-lactone synthase [Oceanomicrobium pacificus]|uniref:Acyl-homoserine-lactone synthase n=1 Tax=Oceanomicrobium pacificus TaxID=2692916 RepID=A0A6B0TYK3_9RHOB|nr:acyl-homoserine-lactone synthase [Oceanomicrobium pacificus]MXU66775.1 hypothetical protein [Oceanomicrobium pacificus]